MNQETQIKPDECPLKGGIVNKARELATLYSEPVVVEFNCMTWPDGSNRERFSIHVVGDGERSVYEQGTDPAAVEAKVADLLNPENRRQLAIAKAVALEMEAAALRASVGGAA